MMNVLMHFTEFLLTFVFDIQTCSTAAAGLLFEFVSSKRTLGYFFALLLSFLTIAISVTLKNSIYLL